METSIKIFLVDDDPFSLNIYKVELEHAGYKNIVMLNGSNACIRHLSEKPKVIFLDHNMDEMNGLDLLRKIRHYYPEIYVVMVSAKQCVRTAVEALKCGAYDYIVKGDNEIRAMRAVLRQIGGLPQKPKPENRFGKFLKMLDPTLLFVGILLILQAGVIVYYYSSALVSSLVMTIVFLMIVLAFSFGIRRGY